MKFALTLLLIPSIIFTSCPGAKKAQNYSVIEDKYCKLTELNFQEVSDTIHRTQNGNVEGGIVVNGKEVFSDKINFDSVRANFQAGNKVFLDQKTFRTVKVSQEYFERFNQMRAAMCNLVAGLKSGILSEAEFKNKAAEQYLAINALFAGLDTGEKKNQK